MSTARSKARASNKSVAKLVHALAQKVAKGGMNVKAVASSTLLIQRKTTLYKVQNYSVHHSCSDSYHLLPKEFLQLSNETIKTPCKFGRVGHTVRQR